MTYSLGGVDSGSFGIDAASGQIMTVEMLDYEARDTFEVTLIATDEGNLLAEVTVIIRVSQR